MFHCSRLQEVPPRPSNISVACVNVISLVERWMIASTVNILARWKIDLTVNGTELGT